MPYPVAAATKSLALALPAAASRTLQLIRAGKTMSEELTAEHFLPHVNKTFRIRGGRHAFTLASVETLAGAAARSPSATRQPFNLIFSGPPRDVLAEGLYTVDVENGPHFELHIIPIYTPERDRQDYQAAFN
jgi:uncharacterized protein DUF6916